MKYLIALAAGLLAGAALGVLILFYNPVATRNTISPLTVSDQTLISLNYPAVAKDAIAYTNDGESATHPYPPKILQLWEAPIRRTDILVTVLYGSGNEPAGLGIKFTSDSEATRILSGEALVDSVWHIHLPGRGSLFVDQVENYWDYIREIVIPAYWSSADSWKGTWYGNTTIGPGALGTARVAGGSGRFRGVETEAVEAVSVQAWSADSGPVAMAGHLTIELPSSTGTLAAE